MEPLSAGASIITVLGAAAAAREGIQRLRSLKHAQARLDSLNNEVCDNILQVKQTGTLLITFRKQITDLELLLTYIKGALGESGLSGAETRSGANELTLAAVRKSESLIRELNVLIESHLVRRRSPNASQQSDVSIRRRGFLKAQRLNEFCVRLKDVRGKLSTALTALTHLQVYSRAPSLPVLIEEATAVRIGLQTDDASLNTQVPGPLITPRNIENLGKDINSASSESSVIITASPTGRCAQYCPCQCHVRVSAQTPSWLQHLFGALFFHYSGTPVFNRRRCNLAQCRPSGGSGRFEYRFPTSVVPWVLSVTASWDKYGRPGGSWSLWTPQYIPESAYGIINVIENSGVSQLEKFMDIHNIAPWAEFTFDGYSLLHLAVAAERWDVCEALLRRGSDIHHRALDQISVAMRAWSIMLTSGKGSRVSLAFRRYLEDSDSLESLNFNIAHRIVSGLLPVSLDEHLDLHPNLLHETDNFGDTPLLRAVRYGSLTATVSLLRRGAAVKVHNKTGATALHYAAWIQGPEFCQTLIDAGANVNAIYPGGMTPLMYAVDGGNLENIRVLLQAGADPNICPDEDATPPAVFYAMPSDNIEALDLLYQYGTDINLIPKSQGHSAIMYATQYNAKDCVVGLLAKGALLHQRGNEGASVVTMAATNASVELMEILTQANIRGLPMDDVHIQQYWKKFQERDSEYTGQKAPVEVERAAFQALLDSIQVEGDSGDDEHDEQYVDAQQQFNS